MRIVYFRKGLTASTCLCLVLAFFRPEFSLDKIPELMSFFTVCTIACFFVYKRIDNMATEADANEAEKLNAAYDWIALVGRGETVSLTDFSFSDKKLEASRQLHLLRRQYLSDQQKLHHDLLAGLLIDALKMNGQLIGTSRIPKTAKEITALREYAETMRVLTAQQVLRIARFGGLDPLSLMNMIDEYGDSQGLGDVTVANMYWLNLGTLFDHRLAVQRSVFPRPEGHKELVANPYAKTTT